jgi:hypothetical protein
MDIPMCNNNLHNDNDISSPMMLLGLDRLWFGLDNSDDINTCEEISYQNVFSVAETQNSLHNKEKYFKLPWRGTA